MVAIPLFATTAPGAPDREMAGRAARVLQHLFEEGVRSTGEGPRNVDVPSLKLPADALRVLQTALLEMSVGHRVVLQRAEDDELTTSQAAKLLGISRPTLIDLLESEEVPYRMVGTHRRIRLSAVQALGRKLERGGSMVPPSPSVDERRQALRDIADLSNQLGYDY